MPDKEPSQTESKFSGFGALRNREYCILCLNKETKCEDYVKPNCDF